MAKPTIEDTRWAVTILGVESTEQSDPDGDLKDGGYQSDDIPDPRDWNWWHRRAHKWFQYLNVGALEGNHTINGTLGVAGAITAGAGSSSIGGALHLAGALTVDAGAVLNGAIVVGGQAFTFTSFTFTALFSVDQLVAASHPLLTGDGPLRVSNSGGALPPPLLAGTDYWSIFVDSGHLQLADSFVNALRGKAIDLLNNGTGTQTISATGGMTRPFDVTATRYLNTGMVVAQTVKETATDTEFIGMALGHVVAGSPTVIGAARIWIITANGDEIAFGLRVSTKRRITRVRGKVKCGAGDTVSLNFGLNDPDAGTAVQAGVSSVGHAGALENLDLDVSSSSGLIPFTPDPVGFRQVTVYFFVSAFATAISIHGLELLTDGQV